MYDTLKIGFIFLHTNMPFLWQLLPGRTHQFIQKLQIFSVDFKITLFFNKKKYYLCSQQPKCSNGISQCEFTDQLNRQEFAHLKINHRRHSNAFSSQRYSDCFKAECESPNYLICFSRTSSRLFFKCSTFQMTFLGQVVIYTFKWRHHVA